MTQPWQKSPVASLTTECRRYLDEAVATGDVDLMEEMSAKMLDVLLIYRRSQPRKLSGATDEELRQMAAAFVVGGDRG